MVLFAGYDCLWDLILKRVLLFKSPMPLDQLHDWWSTFINLKAFILGSVRATLLSFTPTRIFRFLQSVDGRKDETHLTFLRFPWRSKNRLNTCQVLYKIYFVSLVWKIFRLILNEIYTFPKIWVSKINGRSQNTSWWKSAVIFDFLL